MNIYHHMPSASASYPGMQSGPPHASPGMPHSAGIPMTHQHQHHHSHHQHPQVLQQHQRQIPGGVGTSSSHGGPVNHHPPTSHGGPVSHHHQLSGTGNTLNYLPQESVNQSKMQLPGQPEAGGTPQSMHNYSNSHYTPQGFTQQQHQHHRADVAQTPSAIPSDFHLNHHRYHHQQPHQHPQYSMSQHNHSQHPHNIMTSTHSGYSSGASQPQVSHQTSNQSGISQPQHSSYYGGAPPSQPSAGPNYGHPQGNRPPPNYPYHPTPPHRSISGSSTGIQGNVDFDPVLDPLWLDTQTHQRQQQSHPQHRQGYSHSSTAGSNGPGMWNMNHTNAPSMMPPVANDSRYQANTAALTGNGGDVAPMQPSNPMHQHPGHHHQARPPANPLHPFSKSQPPLSHQSRQLAQHQSLGTMNNINHGLHTREISSSSLDKLSRLSSDIGSTNRSSVHLSSTSMPALGGGYLGHPGAHLDHVSGHHFSAYTPPPASCTPNMSNHNASLPPPPPHYQRPPNTRTADCDAQVTEPPDPLRCLSQTISSGSPSMRSLNSSSPLPFQGHNQQGRCIPPLLGQGCSPKMYNTNNNLERCGSKEDFSSVLPKEAKAKLIQLHQIHTSKTELAPHVRDLLVEYIGPINFNRSCQRFSEFHQRGTTSVGGGSSNHDSASVCSPLLTSCGASQEPGGSQCQTSGDSSGTPPPPPGYHASVTSSSAGAGKGPPKSDTWPSGYLWSGDSNSVVQSPEEGPGISPQDQVQSTTNSEEDQLRLQGASTNSSVTEKHNLDAGTGSLSVQTGDMNWTPLGPLEALLVQDESSGETEDPSLSWNLLLTAGKSQSGKETTRTTEADSGGTRPPQTINNSPTSNSLLYKLVYDKSSDIKRGKRNKHDSGSMKRSPHPAPSSVGLPPSPRESASDTQQSNRKRMAVFDFPLQDSNSVKSISPDVTRSGAGFKRCASLDTLSHPSCSPSPKRFAMTSSRLLSPGPCQMPNSTTSAQHSGKGNQILAQLLVDSPSNSDLEDDALNDDDVFNFKSTRRNHSHDGNANSKRSSNASGCISRNISKNSLLHDAFKRPSEQLKSSLSSISEQLSDTKPAVCSSANEIDSSATDSARKSRLSRSSTMSLSSLLQFDIDFDDFPSTNCPSQNNNQCSNNNNSSTNDVFQSQVTLATSSTNQQEPVKKPAINNMDDELSRDLISLSDIDFEQLLGDESQKQKSVTPNSNNAQVASLSHNEIATDDDLFDFCDLLGDNEAIPQSQNQRKDYTGRSDDLLNLLLPSNDYSDFRHDVRSKNEMPVNNDGCVMQNGFEMKAGMDPGKHNSTLHPRSHHQHQQKMGNNDIDPYHSEVHSRPAPMSHTSPHHHQQGSQRWPTSQQHHNTTPIKSQYNQNPFTAIPASMPSNSIGSQQPPVNHQSAAYSPSRVPPNFSRLMKQIGPNVTVRDPLPLSPAAAGPMVPPPNYHLSMASGQTMGARQHQHHQVPPMGHPSHSHHYNTSPHLQQNSNFSHCQPHQQQNSNPGIVYGNSPLPPGHNAMNTQMDRDRGQHQPQITTSSVKAELRQVLANRSASSNYSPNNPGFPAASPRSNLRYSPRPIPTNAHSPNWTPSRSFNSSVVMATSTTDVAGSTRQAPNNDCKKMAAGGERDNSNKSNEKSSSALPDELADTVLDFEDLIYFQGPESHHTPTVNASEASTFSPLYQLSSADHHANIQQSENSSDRADASSPSQDNPASNSSSLIGGMSSTNCDIVDTTLKNNSNPSTLPIGQSVSKLDPYLATV